MKSINIIIILLLATISSFAEVKFNLIFTDNDGIGFKHKENEWMVNEAKKASQFIGKLIKQNATVNLIINATEQTPYAWAPTEHYYTIEEKHGKKVILKAQHKILNNIVENDEPDGHIEFNVSKFNRDKSAEFGLTFVHELTHTLGFLNCQEPTASQLTYYTDFDKLLHDKNGNPLLTNIGDSDGHYFINPKFNGSLEMYACGQTIRKQNGGNFIKIYNPPVYEKGSSYTHVDSSLHPRSIMTSHKCPNEYQLWNNCELGILQELGYEIDWDNYYKIFNQLYPPAITIDIDKEILEETNANVEIVINSDFPQNCSQQSINKKDLGKTVSVGINKESKLLLVDRKTNARLFELKPYVKDLLKTIIIKNKKYKLNLTEKIINNKTEINIKFTK